MFSSSVYTSWESVQRRKYEAMLQILGTDFFHSFFSQRVLNLGCGNGYLESFLRAHGISTATLVGIDTDAVALQNAGMAAVAGNGNALPFSNSSFDAIVAVDSLHLITGNDFERVLRKGGLVLASLFYNTENYREKQAFVEQRLSSFATLAAFTVAAQESEIVIVARK
ncbi:MAG: class I SAM-dependent methyltransferase [Candidatus Aenigmarchaeota archaeon]|nr:class I SAM-dependent methyltransferase [Candidatus Aenigmarchaeota archaeon]